MRAQRLVRCSVATVGVTTLLVAGLATTAQAETTRIAGENRYGTSAKISADFAKTGGTVYVASGQGYADALAGGAVAAQQNAPVLLVRPDAVPAPIQAELERLKPARIVVLGGDAAVGQVVVDELKKTGVEPSVIAGANRFETAALLSERTYPTGAETVYLASGQNYPDALAAGAAAGKNVGPILLTGRDQLAPAAAKELKRLTPKKIVVLGGTGAISSAVFDAARDVAPVERIAGADRFETATKLSAATFTSAKTVVLASGDNFPDALSGAPRADAASAPILLVSAGAEKNKPVCAEIQRLKADNLIVLGGTGAVSAEMLTHIQDWCPGAGEHVFRGKGSTEVKLPELKESIVTLTFEGTGAFKALTLDANGTPVSNLVDLEAGPYSGVQAFNLDGKSASTLKIEGDGAWVARVQPLAAAPAWDVTGSTTGTGDRVIRLGAARAADVTLTRASADGKDFTMILNRADGSNAGTVSGLGDVILPKDATLLRVEADGAWTITKK